ncbi:hypothetical protein BDR04DRAFT_1164994 [Suillus decipiens]|nr:hypothetical protein BDR04DRAFT_1164994 [Suillus decipiens]
MHTGLCSRNYKAVIPWSAIIHRTIKAAKLGYDGIAQFLVFLAGGRRMSDIPFQSMEKQGW